VKIDGTAFGNKWGLSLSFEKSKSEGRKCSPHK